MQIQSVKRIMNVFSFLLNVRWKIMLIMAGVSNSAKIWLKYVNKTFTQFIVFTNFNQKYFHWHIDSYFTYKFWENVLDSGNCVLAVWFYNPLKWIGMSGMCFKCMKTSPFSLLPTLIWRTLANSPLLCRCLIFT